MSVERLRLRDSVAMAAQYGSIGYLLATVTIFSLCRFGCFSSPDVEVADHLQEILERVLLWLLIASPLFLFASLLGGAKNGKVVAALVVLFSAIPLAWLAFVNLMRRN
jgi:hypothetical protein